LLYPPEAYETLVLDALLGDPTLFMRSDQVEEAWDVVTTIQENDKSLSLDKYEAGVGVLKHPRITSPPGTRISNTDNEEEEEEEEEEEKLEQVADGKYIQ
jgi:glucose-6-phosphate 1-dehydrogenase